MTTSERNKHLRELANMAAAQVAEVFDKRRKLRCHRITRRRGHAVNLGGSLFSIPEWTATADRRSEFFLAYVAHEAVHCLTGFGDGSGNFRDAEKRALAVFGLRPVYISSHNYPVAFLNFDNQFLCDGWGHPPGHPRFDYRNQIPAARLRAQGITLPW